MKDFESSFELIRCVSPEQLNRCFALRYQVFCQEQKVWSPENYRDQFEFDQFDKRAVHMLVHSKRLQIDVATVRLVLVDPQDHQIRFPVEQFDILRREARDRLWHVPRANLAEISRFCISRQFRRRYLEDQVAHGITQKVFVDDQEDRRHNAQIVLGLFKAVLLLSQEKQITHCYAAMEPSLMRLLNRVGIRFTPIGPMVDFHGMRQPYIARLTTILDCLYQERIDLWNFLTDDGRLAALFYPDLKKTISA